MWSRSMSTLLVLVGASGAGTALSAQSGYVTVGATVGATAVISGPRAVACHTGRARHVRGRAPCAVPRRRTVAVRPYRAGGEWVAVGWSAVLDVRWVHPGQPYLAPGQLRGVIGREDYRRIRHHARSLGLRGPLTGAWTLDRYGPTVLEIRVDRFPVAALIDYDRDGFTDVTLLRRHR